MVRHSLAVPLRGGAQQELIVPPLLGLASAAASAPVPMREAVPLCTLLFMLTSDDRCEQLVWEDTQQLHRGFLPEDVYNRLCAELVSWSLHTAVGFEPSLSRTHAHVAFAQHRLLLSRGGEGQPSVAVTLLSGGSPAPVLERLRLLLRGVLAACPQLKSLVLLPLPGADNVLVAADGVSRLDAGQTVVIHSRSTTAR